MKKETRGEREREGKGERAKEREGVYARIGVISEYRAQNRFWEQANIVKINKQINKSNKPKQTNRTYLFVFMQKLP